MTGITATQKVEDLASTVGTDIGALRADVQTLGGVQDQLNGLTAEVLLRQRLAFLRGRLSPGAAPAAPVSTATPTVSVDTSALTALFPSRGMSATDGRKLSKYEHIRQSLSDIFRTAIGSRVLRRTYGSRLPELVDAPMNDSTLLDIIAAAAESALTWEPRISVLLVQVNDVTADGVLSLGIGAEDEDGNPVAFEEVLAA